MKPTPQISRRAFLAATPLACAGAALGARCLPRARAKNVIYIHLAGSPSTLDLFDWKPKVNELHQKPCPDSFLQKERFAFIKGHPKMLGTPYRFTQHKATGGWFSELVPRIAGIADRVTFVHSMWTDQFNHAPAQLLLQTGAPRFGRPSMGAWIWHGLATQNPDLPGFVVLNSTRSQPDAGRALWGSGFLPTVYQGVEFRAKGDPVLYLQDPPGVDRQARRRMLDALGDLNELAWREHHDAETRTRIAQYELAYRMQKSVPEICDITHEPEAVRERYGVEPGKDSLANNLLLARRLVENGVRFVQLYDWGWDHHGTGTGDDIVNALPAKCRIADRATAALIEDLDARGLLAETLVVWGGEFGRTPMNEERNGSKFLGRDHHPHCFTVMLAGAGIRRGFKLGATDELGYRVTENPVHVHDLQATILHTLGIDHEKLTWRYQGRDFRLTDVAGKVVAEVLA